MIDHTAPRPRCAFCGRQIKPQNEIPGVGYVGPECIKHYEKLRRALVLVGVSISRVVSESVLKAVRELGFKAKIQADPAKKHACMIVITGRAHAGGGAAKAQLRLEAWGEKFKAEGAA